MESESKIDELMKKDLSKFRQGLYPRNGEILLTNFLWEIIKDFEKGCLIAAGLEYCIENMIMDPQIEIKSGKNKNPKLKNVGSFLTYTQSLLDSNTWFDSILSNIISFFIIEKNEIPIKLKTVLESFMEKVEEEKKNRKNVKEEDFKKPVNMKSFGVLYRYGVFLVKAIQCLSEEKIDDIKNQDNKTKYVILTNASRTNFLQKKIENIISGSWEANLTKYYFSGLLHRFFYLLNGFSNFQSILLSDYYTTQFFFQIFLRLLFNNQALNIEIFLPKEKEYQPIYVPIFEFIEEKNILPILQICGLLETETSKKASKLKTIPKDEDNEEDENKNFRNLNLKIENILNNTNFIKTKWQSITNGRPMTEYLDLEQIPTVVRINGWSNFLNYLNYGFKCDFSKSLSIETVYSYLIHLCEKSMDPKNLSVQNQKISSVENSTQEQQQSSLFDEWKYFLCWNQIFDNIYLNKETVNNGIKLSSFCDKLSQFKNETILEFFSQMGPQDQNNSNSVELTADEKLKYKPFTFFITNGLFASYYGIFEKINTHEFLKNRFFFQSLIEICEFYRFPFFVFSNAEFNKILALSQYFCLGRNIYKTSKAYNIPSTSYSNIIDFLTSSNTDYKSFFFKFNNLIQIEEKLFVDRTKTQSSFFSNCQKNIPQYSIKDITEKTQSVQDRTKNILLTLK